MKYNLYIEWREEDGSRMNEDWLNIEEDRVRKIVNEWMADNVIRVVINAVE